MAVRTKTSYKWRQLIGEPEFPRNLSQKMASPASKEEADKCLAVLEEAIQRCQMILGQRGAQEVALRDGLCLLKFAHADAERALLGSERPDWLTLSGRTIQMVSALLEPLKSFSPQLNNWERARDPKTWGLEAGGGDHLIDIGTLWMTETSE